MVEKSNDHETKKAEESKKIELVSTKQIPTEVLHDDEETKDEAAQAERERQRKAL
jgi:glycylpeptide N-tetradecanoyltransferase